MALVEVKDLTVHFTRNGPGVNAVDNITFNIYEGEILGLVGESGSGKSVTAKAISWLLPTKNVEVSGSITLCGQQMVGISEVDARHIHGDEVAIVFQEPMTSMNPLVRIGRQVGETLRIHQKHMPKAEIKQRVLEALRQADISDPEDVYNKYPHEMSGGMLQRAMIASAIINNPKLLIADEPTTALDVTIQAQIIDLLIRLNKETGMSVLFISHNLNVVRKLCHRVIVMQGGKIVERGTAESIFHDPQEAYTKQLIAAIPDRDHRLV